MYKGIDGFPKFNKDKEGRPDKGISRRDFLKFGALAAGAAVVGGLGGAIIKEVEEQMKYDEFGNKKDEKDAKEVRKPEQAEIKTEPKFEKHVPGEDKEAAQKVLKFSADKVILDEKTRKAIENHWYSKYRNDPKMKKSLEDAYVSMEPHRNALEKIFSAEGIPQKFIYLAIPESHWNWEADSPKGARGPYQIVYSTGKLYGMDVFREANVADERNDPLASARVCARILKDLYERTGDWNLALSGYNGGFIWQYLRGRGKDGCSYEGFLKFIESRVNGLKKMLSQKEWYHRVGDIGESSLIEIADYFGVNQKVIAKYNKLKYKKKNPIVKSGQLLKIPLLSAKVKKRIYDNIIGGFIENLNYPGKFNAVYDIISEK